MPDDDHEIALPDVSVMVMIVLLKVAATCATPTTTFFFSFLRARPAPAGFAMLLRHFLLAGDRLGGTFARARVRVGTLTANREVLAVTQAAIAAQVHQALDVHRDFAAQITFDEIVAVDHFADLDGFGFGEVMDTAVRRDADLLHNLACLGGTDSMDVAEADFDPLLGWDIDAGD